MWVLKGSIVYHAGVPNIHIGGDDQIQLTRLYIDQQQYIHEAFPFTVSFSTIDT